MVESLPSYSILLGNFGPINTAFTSGRKQITWGMGRGINTVTYGDANSIFLGKNFNIFLIFGGQELRGQVINLHMS